MATQFQVMLLSNSSTPQYPNNKANDFTTVLSSPIRLKGEWEVAMTDILHPFNAVNIQKEIQMGILIVDAKDRKPPDITQAVDPITRKARQALVNLDRMGKPCAFRYLQLAAGYYLSLDQICRILSQKLRTVWDELRLESPAVNFHYDPHMDRTTMEESRYFCILFSLGNYLQRVLGLYPYIDADTGEEKTSDVDTDRVCYIRLNVSALIQTERQATTEKLIGTRSPQLDTASTMFVRSDLVQYQRVGDSQAPILSQIPCQGHYGEEVYWHVEEPLYIPVAQTHIPSIRISLCNETGTLFPLAEGGLTACYLSFRKKRDTL